MRFIAVYDDEIGFNFPELSDELQYEIYHERRKQELILLIKGYYKEGIFFFEYSKKTNYLLLSYADKDASGQVKDVTLILYTKLKEALADFESLVKSKEDVRYWKTPYYNKDFEQDYIDPEEDHSKMRWRKKGVLWVAQGKLGKFIIRQLHRVYIGRYEGKDKSFNMPPDKYISKLKARCEENAYWEG